MRTRNGIFAVMAAIALLLASGSALARGFIQSPELLDKIKIGVTTEKEVEQILGLPANRSHFPRLNLISMDYLIAAENGKDRIDVAVMIGNDGIVRDIQKVPRYGGSG